jgi:hypothetical protein
MNAGSALDAGFDSFAALDSTAVREQVRARFPHGMGVGIPFNGTRRWYMATYGASAGDVFSGDYLTKTLFRIFDVVGMMFADGVDTVYSPLIGRALLDRGEDYMAFAIEAVARPFQQDAERWYAEHHTAAGCYGDLNLLPLEIRARIGHVRQNTTPRAKHRFLWGVFADEPLADIIRRVTTLHTHLAAPPTPEQLLHEYFGAHVPPLALWIGSDQPTVFDVPLVLHEHTALYFLQFPTLYLDHRLWRRLLYDVLHVRGDEETLYPDNVSDARHITGLGVRRHGFWSPSTL